MDDKKTDSEDLLSISYKTLHFNVNIFAGGLRFYSVSVVNRQNDHLNLENVYFYGETLKLCLLLSAGTALLSLFAQNWVVGCVVRTIILVSPAWLNNITLDTSIDCFGWHRLTNSTSV